MTTVIVSSGSGLSVFTLPWWWPSAFSAAAILLITIGRRLQLDVVRQAGEFLMILGAVLILVVDALSRNWAALNIDLGLLVLFLAALILILRPWRSSPAQVD